MNNFFRDKRGFTVLEVLVALTILGLISVPITILIGQSMQLNNTNKEQIEINSISRIISENVRTSVKGHGDVLGNSVSLFPASSTYQDGSGLKVKDSSGNEYSLYEFDAKHSSVATYNTVEYKITLKKKTLSGTFNTIKKFNVEVNQLK